MVEISVFDGASRADASEVVFIQTGSLKIFRQGAGGKDSAIEVALLGPDDIFGLVEMMGFFEATRWAVAQTVTEVFVISMSIARELSVLDPRTKALALKAVTARMHWEAVCEASYAQEHVSITPAMMTYANYQINPEGVTQVANKKKSDTKSRRAEARADLEDVVANTITLLAEAEVYEQQGEYLRAEEIIGKCHEICTKMLKRANELVKNGDMDRAARDQRRSV